MITEPTTSPTFYALPATALEPGMSTADGQDVVSVDVAADGTVYADVYTPRSDDPDADADNLDATDCRIYAPGELVAMADFPDTPNFAADHELALPAAAATR
jgi:hypothetical protein